MRRKKSPPEHVGNFLKRYFAKRGWQDKLRDYQIWTQWPELVGRQLASRSWPVKLRHQVLTIAVSNASWLTQLQFMKLTLIEKFQTTLHIQLENIYFVIQPAPPKVLPPFVDNINKN